MTGETQAGSDGRRQVFISGDHWPTYGALAALVLLLTLNSIFIPGFLDPGNLHYILWRASPTLLVALGMTFVMASGGIDLSVGAVMAVASSAAAASLDLGAGPSILLGLAAGAGVGAFNGALVAGARVPPVIVTLALLISGRGVARLINKDGLILVSDPSFEFLARGHVGALPVTLISVALVIAGAVFVMRATPFARYVLAVGGNEAAARLAGVRVGRTKAAVYVLSGLLAGLAGVIETAMLGASDDAKIGLGVEIDAIAAAVVGGTTLRGGRASIVGTVIGALMMQVITTSFHMQQIDYSWGLVVKSAIIIMAVYVQRPKVD